jgi:hypothetical protein
VSIAGGERNNSRSTGVFNGASCDGGCHNESLTSFGLRLTSAIRQLSVFTVVLSTNGIL